MTNRFLPFILTLSIIFNFSTLLIMGLELKYFRQHTIYDIDMIRQEYIDDTGYFMRLGCDFGTDRTPVVPNPNATEFNLGPSEYCAIYVKDHQEAIMERAYNLGKNWQRHCEY
jgi:hypothetical protein